MNFIWLSDVIVLCIDCPSYIFYLWYRSSAYHQHLLQFWSTRIVLRRPDNAIPRLHQHPMPTHHNGQCGWEYYVVNTRFAIRELICCQIISSHTFGLLFHFISYRGSSTHSIFSFSTCCATRHKLRIFHLLPFLDSRSVTWYVDTVE